MKKNNNNIILHFITTFYDFALKTETGSAKRKVKPNLKTRNVNGKC